MRSPPALDWPGAAGPGRTFTGYCNLTPTSAAQILARVARLFTTRLCSSPVRLNQSPTALVWLNPSPVRLNPSPVWLAPPSLVREQLGRHRDRVADRQRRAAAPVSGSPDRARPVRRPGTTVHALSAKLASSPSRHHWGPVMHDSCSCRQSRWAHRGRATNQPASGLLTTQPASSLLTTQPASGLLTIGRRRRRRARSRTPPTRMLPARRPGGPGTRGARLEVITVRVHSGHDSFPVRAESARPTSAEQRAQPPFPLNPATGVNRRL